MYKEELNRLIEEGKIPRYLFLFGEDGFFLEIYLKKILKSIKGAEVYKIYFDEYEFNKAKNILIQNSLFASKNLLLLKHTFLSKDEVKALIEAVKSNSNSYFILVVEGYSKRLKELAKLFNNNYCIFFKPTFKEAFLFFDNWLKKEGIGLDRKKLINLIEAFNGDLFLIYNELKQFKESSHFEFDGVVEVEKVVKDFLLYNKIDWKKLLEVNEIELFVFLFRYIKNLFFIQSYIKIYGKKPNSKDIFGFNMPKAVFEDMLNSALKIDFKKFKDIFKILIEAEFDFKVRGVGKRDVILKLFLELNNIKRF